MKKLLVVLIFIMASLTFSLSGSQNAIALEKPGTVPIKPENNASLHNNLGLMYVAEGWYPAAIEEFRIAISLNPNSQATSVYYTNIGDTFMKIGRYKLAEDAYQHAINQFNLNFMYYQNLVKSIKAQGLVNQKIEYYEKNQDNPLNMVILGLLYVEDNDLKRGIIKLDEFCMQEPELIITTAVRNHLRKLVQPFK